MAVDEDTRLSLNLVHGDPRFVIIERHDGDQVVTNPATIAAGSGMYWVAGTSFLAGGREVESVFVVDSDSGCELFGVYWLIDSTWIQSSDHEALAAAGLERSDVFPFDWRFAIPPENDIFH